MISVIVIIYNEEDYVSHCIESILQQTYTDLQVLLIDDGSTDRSGKICDEYVAKDNRCRAIHQENKGIARARNVGLKHVAGEYVMFVDGDDYIHPRFCEILHNAIVLFGCPLAIADAKRVVPAVSDIELFDDMPCQPEVLSQDELMQRLFTVAGYRHTDIMVWGRLYKRELLNDVFFKNTVGEDIEYNSRILTKASNAVFFDVPLYYWVQRPSSISKSPFSRRNIDELNVWKICMDNLPIHEIRYRGYALQRLYKNILNIRHNTPKALKSYANETIALLVNKTHVEFKQNRQISFSFKIAVLLMYYMPMLYSLFRLSAKHKAIVERAFK